MLRNMVVCRAGLVLLICDVIKYYELILQALYSPGTCTTFVRSPFAYATTVSCFYYLELYVFFLISAVVDAMLCAAFVNNKFYGAENLRYRVETLARHRIRSSYNFFEV